MVTDGKPNGWGAKEGLAQLLAVPPRASIVEDEARVPAIQPVSKVVLGPDPYQTATPADAVERIEKAGR